MQFVHPYWLQTFWILGVLLALNIWANSLKKKRLKAFANIRLISTNYAPERGRIKTVLFYLASVLLILALAQPQWGNVKKEIRRKGIELMFVVDTSLSMLAQDASPSRIEKAKFEMKAFLKKLKGDRIGIVTFAGSGFVQSPLTLDYDAFLLFANSIQVGYIPDAGTSLSEAIRTAVKSFPDTKKKHQAIILLTDGEHQEGDINSVAQVAKEANIRIYTIGIGTQEGAPIPLMSEEGKKIGYKKDRAGQIVITKLNEPLLKQIAETTGGIYAPATPDEREVEWIYGDFKKLDEKEFKQKIVTEKEDHFQLFIAIAAILLFFELLIGETRRNVTTSK